jgi:hypothetical protein
MRGQVGSQHDRGGKVVHEHGCRRGDPRRLPAAGVLHQMADVRGPGEGAERDGDPEDAEEQQRVGGPDGAARADAGDRRRRQPECEHRERGAREHEHEDRRGEHDDATTAAAHGAASRAAKVAPGMCSCASTMRFVRFEPGRRREAEFAMKTAP